MVLFVTQTFWFVPGPLLCFLGRFLHTPLKTWGLVARSGHCPFGPLCIEPFWCLVVLFWCQKIPSIRGLRQHVQLRVFKRFPHHFTTGRVYLLFGPYEIVPLFFVLCGAPMLVLSLFGVPGWVVSFAFLVPPVPAPATSTPPLGFFLLSGGVAPFNPNPP